MHRALLVPITLVSVLEMHLIKTAFVRITLHVQSFKPVYCPTIFTQYRHAHFKKSLGVFVFAGGEEEYVESSFLKLKYN